MHRVRPLRELCPDAGAARNRARTQVVCRTREDARERRGRRRRAHGTPPPLTSPPPRRRLTASPPHRRIAGSRACRRPCGGQRHVSGEHGVHIVWRALAFTHRSKHKRVAANVAAPAKHAEVEERLSARELATIRANAVKGAVVRCLKASKALTLAELTARVTQRLAHFCAPHAPDVEQAIDSLVDKGVSLPRPQLTPAPATVLFLALHFAAVHSPCCHCRSHWQQQYHRHHHCYHLPPPPLPLPSSSPPPTSVTATVCRAVLFSAFPFFAVHRHKHKATALTPARVPVPARHRVHRAGQDRPDRPSLHRVRGAARPVLQGSQWAPRDTPVRTRVLPINTSFSRPQRHVRPPTTCAPSAKPSRRAVPTHGR